MEELADKICEAIDRQLKERPGLTVGEILDAFDEIRGLLVVGKIVLHKLH